MNLEVALSQECIKLHEKTGREQVLSSGVIYRPAVTRKRCSDESIKDALRFIFRPENVQLLSWGTKKIRIGDKWFEFPAVLRKAPIEKLFRDYNNRFTEGSIQEHAEQGQSLGRSSFFTITDAVTRGPQKRKSAVDYVFGALVYGNIRLARDIVSGEVCDEDQRRVLLNQLDAVEQFLKFTYLEHIDKDSDIFHSKKRSLLGGSAGPGSFDQSLFSSSCDSCLAPFQIILNIEKHLNEKREDILSALKEILHKIFLYMGHQQRCYNQEKRITTLFGKLNKDRTTSTVVILLNCKMKFEPIRYREKTTEFFGKKGMSWHGAVIFYKVVPKDDVDGAPREEEASNDMVDLNTMFFEYLVSNDTSQDCVAVCSILDAILERVRIELPSVKNVYLLSDNASCYQNELLPIMAPFIARNQFLSLQGFVHGNTER